VQPVQELAAVGEVREEVELREVAEPVLELPLPRCGASRRLRGRIERR